MATKKNSLNINLSSLRLPENEIEMGTFDNLPLEEILRQVKIEAERILSEKEPDHTGEKINVQGDWFGLKLMRQQQAEAMKEPHLSNVRIEGPGVIHPTLREQIAAEMYCSADYIRTRCSGFSSKRKSKFSRSCDNPPLSEREQCEQIAVKGIELGLMIARQDFWHEAWPFTKGGAEQQHSLRQKVSPAGVKARADKRAQRIIQCRDMAQSYLHLDRPLAAKLIAQKLKSEWPYKVLRNRTRSITRYIKDLFPEG